MCEALVEFLASMGRPTVGNSILPLKHNLSVRKKSSFFCTGRLGIVVPASGILSKYMIRVYECYDDYGSFDPPLSRLVRINQTVGFVSRDTIFTRCFLFPRRRLRVLDEQMHGRSIYNNSQASRTTHRSGYWSAVCRKVRVLPSLDWTLPCAVQAHGEQILAVSVAYSAKHQRNDKRQLAKAFHFGPQSVQLALRSTQAFQRLHRR